VVFSAKKERMSATCWSADGLVRHAESQGGDAGETARAPATLIF
jgi:hypothetical protein